MMMMITGSVSVSDIIYTTNIACYSEKKIQHFDHKKFRVRSGKRWSFVVVVVVTSFSMEI